MIQINLSAVSKSLTGNDKFLVTLIDPHHKAHNNVIMKIDIHDKSTTWEHLSVILDEYVMTNKKVSYYVPEFVKFFIDRIDGFSGKMVFNYFTIKFKNGEIHSDTLPAIIFKDMIDTISARVWVKNGQLWQANDNSRKKIAHNCEFMPAVVKHKLNSNYMTFGFDNINTSISVETFMEYDKFGIKNILLSCKNNMKPSIILHNNREFFSPYGETLFDYNQFLTWAKTNDIHSPTKNDVHTYHLTGGVNYYSSEEIIS